MKLRLGPPAAYGRPIRFLNMAKFAATIAVLAYSPRSIRRNTSFLSASGMTSVQFASLFFRFWWAAL